MASSASERVTVHADPAVNLTGMGPSSAGSSSSVGGAASENSCLVQTEISEALVVLRHSEVVPPLDKVGGCAVVQDTGGVSETVDSSSGTSSTGNTTEQSKEDLLKTANPAADGAEEAGKPEDSAPGPTPELAPKETADENAPGTTKGLFYFHHPPELGVYTEFIRYLLFRGLVQDNCDASPEENEEFTKKYYNTTFIQQLCTSAKTVLASKESIVELEVGEDETLVVVGDIHGQFFDFCTSVLSQQFSSEKNPSLEDRMFLFLGDFVDRGANSIEVILLTLALLVEYPAMIHLTRGNHEEYKTCKVYGFLTEAECKMGSIPGNVVFTMINSVFVKIPLAAKVSAPQFKFFATHGGISPGLEKNVMQLNSIDRCLYGGKDGSVKMTADNRNLVYGLLWSDPTNDSCLFKPNPRGCGFLFGIAASQEFCKNNNVDFICRAHQVVMEGYLWRHHDKVLTVFSAPNYCGINGNLGAVMIVNGSKSKPEFSQYEAYEDMDYPAVPEHFNFPFKWCFE